MKHSEMKTGICSSRMSYSEVYEIISRYANEMLPAFADGFSRFPVGGNAAMIVNFLNGRAKLYHDIDENIAAKISNAAGEIIERCG